MAEDEKIENAKLAKQRFENMDKYSPMMQHYIATKAKYLDCILIFM